MSFFFKFVFDIIGSFHFHISFRISLLILIYKKVCSNFSFVGLLVIFLSGVGIRIILTLWKCREGFHLHLYFERLYVWLVLFLTQMFDKILCEAILVWNFLCGKVLWNKTYLSQIWNYLCFLFLLVSTLVILLFKEFGYFT